jgi:hypothetical protein
MRAGGLDRTAAGLGGTRVVSPDVDSDRSSRLTRTLRDLGPAD